MATTRLTDTVVDTPATVVGGDGEPVRLRSFDFRRRSRFSRDQIRSLEVAHEVFSRRFASAATNALRALVQLEQVATDEVSYDDYVRSMPSPNLLAVIALPPLPGPVIVELDVQLALQLVDRLLGGRGGTVAMRRPTELETFLLRHLLAHVTGALTEALEPLASVTPELGAIDYNPQLLSVAPPGEMVLLLTYRLAVAQEPRSDGLLTLCYPGPTLSPVLERLEAQAWVEHSTLPAGDNPAARNHLADALHDVGATLSVRLGESAVAAGDLAALQVGDVLSLDHGLNSPVRGHVDGVDLFEGHVGRRGRRLALQITRRLEPPAPAVVEPEPVFEGAPQ